MIKGDVDPIDRRDAMKLIAAAASAGCLEDSSSAQDAQPTGLDVVTRLIPLGYRWETRDPFLFCVHHDDAYPAGNELMGPVGSLAGRRLGMDFEGRDGWRMGSSGRLCGNG